MNYYKYCKAERISDLFDQYFRFSQPRAENDPFESQPYFNAPATDHELVEGFLKTMLDLPPLEWEKIKQDLHYNGEQSDFGSYFEKHPEEIPELIKFHSPLLLKDITPKYQHGIDMLVFSQCLKSGIIYLCGHIMLKIIEDS